MPSSLQIKLSSCSYPIHLGEAVGTRIREQLEQLRLGGQRSVVVTDAAVAAACAGFLGGTFTGVPTLVLEPGETTKSLAQLGRVLDFLAAEGVDRGGVLWVVGGGVIGDLGGFAAACYLRGIGYFQVPTTLLAMVDSSVGGKTGLNLAAGKNLVGAFHHPRAVFIGRDFLATLPPREFAAGAAEVIKYGLLGASDLFDRLEREALTARSPDLLDVIGRCCAMKAAIVQVDERETAAEGGRALLNLGHTFGHALEQVTDYRAYLHGEAVAIGLVAAARLSRDLGLLPEAEVARVAHTIAAHGLPTRLRAPLRVTDLLAAMQRDKKVRAGRLRFVVLERLGQAATRGDIAPAAVEAVWREVGAA